VRGKLNAIKVKVAPLHAYADTGGRRSYSSNPFSTRYKDDNKKLISIYSGREGELFSTCQNKHTVL
jgi:hypothetical protein